MELHNISFIYTVDQPLKAPTIASDTTAADGRDVNKLTTKFGSSLTSEGIKKLEIFNFSLKEMSINLRTLQMCLFDSFQKLSVTIGRSFFSTHHDDHEVTTSCGFFLQGPTNTDSIPEDLI